MRKSFYLFILAAAAGLCAILAVVRAVDREKGKIVVEETVLEGDVAAAAGVSVEIGTHWQGQLLWNTSYQPGHVQDAASTFDFSGQSVEWNETEPQAWNRSFTESAEAGIWRDYNTSPVDLDVTSLHFGTAAAVGAEGYAYYSSVDTEYMPWSRLVQAAEEQTAAGETRTVNLRVRDYYDFYPLELSVRREDWVYSWDSWWEFATEFFELPIPEDEMAEITVGKNQEGEVVTLDCRSAGEGYFPVTASVCGDKGYYFTFYLQNNEGSARVQQEYGGGYGVYWLPIASGSGGRESIADVERMTKAAQLPEGVIPVAMRLDREGRILHLLAWQNGQYIVLTYAVNKEEGEKIELCQQLTVSGGGEDSEIGSGQAGETGSAEEAGVELARFQRMTVQEDGILLTWIDNRFAFIAREGEEYRFWCAGVFPAAEKTPDPYGYTVLESTFPYEHAFAFDGTRLALAAFENWDSLDSRLLVYREGRLAYSGYYRYSGELDAVLGLDRKIIPWGDRFSSARHQGVSPNPLHVSIQ